MSKNSLLHWNDLVGSGRAHVTKEIDSELLVSDEDLVQSLIAAEAFVCVTATEGIDVIGRLALMENHVNRSSKIDSFTSLGRGNFLDFLTSHSSQIPLHFGSLDSHGSMEISVLEKALIQECSTTFRKLELELLKQCIQQTQTLSSPSELFGYPSQNT